MKTVGIVCEFNPFHEGHRHLIEQARQTVGEDSTVVCLLSGDFVQRGEPAVYDKYTRASAAIEGGADLVLELPYPFCCSVAECFANAAVFVFHALREVDVLAFGSENKNTDELTVLSERLASDIYKSAFQIKRKEERTLSFPKLTDAVYRMLYQEELSLSSNEILGVSYIAALKRLHSSVIPLAFPMLPGVHATEKREKILAAGEGACLEYGESAILTALRLRDEKNRFVKASKGVCSLSELFQAVSNTADTDARLRRELLQTVTGMPKGIEKEKPEFTVLLAANEKGVAFLKRVRKKADIKILTKKAKGKSVLSGSKQFDQYRKGELLYSSFLKERKKGCYLSLKSPIIFQAKDS